MSDGTQTAEGSEREDVSAPLTADQFTEIIANQGKANLAAMEKIVDARLSDLSKPDRSDAERLDTGGEQTSDRSDRTEIQRMEGVAISRVQPLEHCYRSMDEETRLWRTPESDHWMQQFILGTMGKDQARASKACDKLEEWCGRVYGRATFAEGTEGAAGAISAGTAGPTIPRPLENLVLIARDRASTMRRFANQFVMTAQTHTVPTAGAMTFSMQLEGANLGALTDEPPITSVQLSAHKGIVRAVLTRESLADNAINAVAVFTERAGGAIATGEDLQFWSTGNGTPPNVSSRITGTPHVEETTAALGFVDVVLMKQELPQAYRRAAAWYAASDVVQFLSTLVSSGDERMFYQGLGDAPALVNDDPDQIGRLMQRNIFEVPLPDGAIGYGDVRSAYTVGTRQNIVSLSSSDVRFEFGEVVFIWETRFDGNNVDAVAFRLAEGITSATTAATVAP